MRDRPLAALQDSYEEILKAALVRSDFLEIWHPSTTHIQLQYSTRLSIDATPLLSLLLSMCYSFAANVIFFLF
jgi:hypothetical protein